jgi:hypothetical protein
VKEEGEAGEGRREKTNIERSTLNVQHRTARMKDEGQKAERGDE